MSESHDPGGKFTIYDLLSLFGALLMCGLGAKLGMYVGWPMAVIGGIAGLLLGGIPGKLLGDHGIMSLFRELNAQDTPALYIRLRKQYFLSHLIVLILLKRGEPVGHLQDTTLEMLLADDSDVRWHGWRTLNLNFPDTAARLTGINPRGSPESYREKIEDLRWADNITPGC
jgi:hypothetical protein